MSLILEGYGEVTNIITDGFGGETTSVSYRPIIIRLEQTLSELVETAPGPLSAEILIKLLETGKFSVKLDDARPIFSNVYELKSADGVVKVFPEGKIESTKGIEIPNLWGCLFDEKPGIIYSKERFTVDLKGNIVSLQPNIAETEGKIFSPSIVKIAEG